MGNVRGKYKLKMANIKKLESYLIKLEKQCQIKK